MSIREIASRKTVTVVSVEGLGDVRVAVLKAGEMLEISKLDGEKSGMAMIARCVVTDDDKPIFTNAADVATTVDWPLAQELLKACYAANNINTKIQDAEKNGSSPITGVYMKQR